jgi:hypothetical protein
MASCFSFAGMRFLRVAMRLPWRVVSRGKLTEARAVALLWCRGPPNQVAIFGAQYGQHILARQKTESVNFQVAA